MNPRPSTLVTARLLAAWGSLETPAWILLIATLVLPLPRNTPILITTGLTSLLAGTYGLYLGWRIRFDAAIFLDLAESRIADGEAFDAALTEMGYLNLPARSEAERCQGALRLLRHRILCVLIQVAALAVGYWMP